MQLPFRAALEGLTDTVQDGEHMREAMWTVLSILRGVADACRHILTLKGEWGLSLNKLSTANTFP